MARRHDNDGDADDERRTPLLGRRRFLTATGAGAIGGMIGLSGEGRAAQNVVNLGDEGLQDGDNISPYIDEYWTSGTEVRIPAGDYVYDGSGLNGRRGNCSLIGSEDGVRFHRYSDSAAIRPTIQCTHGTMRVENVTVRGRCPSASNRNGSRWRFDALDPDSRIEVVNVNHPDGSANRSDANAFLSYRDHRGTLHFKNCYVANFGNSSFYTNLGYRSGESNPVIIENCVVVNANGAIRGGQNGSQYVDCTFVWRDRPRSWADGNALARGIRWDHNGHDNLVENCHFYFGGSIGSAAESLDVADQGASTSGVVRDVYIHTEGNYGGITDDSGGSWSYDNVNVTGPGSARVGPRVSVGSQAPDLRNENIVWMPESRTARPGGVERNESMFEIVSTDDDAELDYRFHVDGTARKARASQRNSSIGEGNDAVDLNGDGSVTVTGRTGLGLGDAFLVDGEVSGFERTGGNSSFRLLLDGEDVTDQLVSDSSSGDEGDGDEEEDSPSTFEIVSTDDDAGLDYRFDVAGSAEKAEASQRNTSVGENNDTIADNGDGTVTVEGTTGHGFGDAFTVDGEISGFERTGGDSGFELLLDGEDVTDELAGDQADGGDGSSMFEIVSTDADAELDYAFTVAGGAAKAEASPDNTSVGENNDSIADNGDGTVTVTGRTGLGLGDAFLVDGEVSGFERTGGDSGFELLLDGEDVTDELAGDGGSGDTGPQRVYVDGTTAPEEVNEYRIEVTGEIQPDPENTNLVDGGLAWDALADVVDGSTAVGVVGNGVDAYTFTGEIVDLTVEGNAAAEVED